MVVGVRDRLIFSTPYDLLSFRRLLDTLRNYKETFFPSIVMPSYKKNYIKIYFWQLLSFVLNFVALFIVTPMLSSMQEIYGIYSVCASLNIFLQYADIGFLVAGKKFAAETIVTGDRVSEKKFVGTSMYIFSAFSLFLSIGLVVCIVHPDILISGISNTPIHLETARKLLYILGFSIIVTILQKYVEFIYSLRLEEYKAQRAIICGNIIKIASVPLYFFNNRYDIVGYYAFSQLVMFLSLVGVLYKSKEIGYGLTSIFKVLHFDRKSFDIMKGLALGGFGSTLAWILYYEIDTIAISAMLGAKMVAIYAVGRSIQSFVRSITGIVYSPYNVRFYYYYGNNDVEGMKKFFNMLTCFLSFLIIPIVAIVFFAEPFTTAWVGPEYKDSILIMQLLVFCFIFNCITNPCTSILFSYNKAKELLRLSFIQPLCFWIGVFLTVRIWGINSFAYFKLLSCTISALFCIIIATRSIDMSPWKLVFRNFLIPLVISSVICWIIYILSRNYLNVTDKSSDQLICCIFWIGIACVATFGGYNLFNKPFRQVLLNIIKK